MPEGAPEAALFSLHDRRGAVELARALAARGDEVWATSGTAAYLREHGVEAREVAELTGFPSLFAGRVKTLHPRVFGGLLADRDDPVHEAERSRFGIPRIGTLVVNLYPFEMTVAEPGATLEEALEQIDIGGVALVRAAAKNFAHVTVLVDPDQYALGPAAREDRGMRRALATRAFERTAEYDSAIARYLEAGLLANDLPGSLALALPLRQTLRYGENPQSRAAFYLSRGEALPEQLGGKALSYNNLLDLDAALRLLVRGVEGARRDGVRAAVVKHTIPCGVAERPAAAEALQDALAADRISAYGGIVAVEGDCDEAAARALAGTFLEIVAAPGFDAAALARLRAKTNLRIIRFDPNVPERLARETRVRSALGGVLAEDDDPSAAPETLAVVSRRSPTPREWDDLHFAWDVVRHVKSNGVVIARDRVTRGICAGQTNRVSAVEIAATRAGEFAAGAACASDGFFPFADGLEAAAHAGCTAVIAPKGSIRDAEVIAAADARDLALVFSTHRYFLH